MPQVYQLKGEHLGLVCAVTVRHVSNPFAHEIVIHMNPVNKIYSASSLRLN